MVKLLFVCTGNICRSPTAEGVFRHLVAQAGLDGRIGADSAGTHGYHIGEPPDPRTVKTAKARGVDLSGLRARKVALDDFYAFDHILAMDSGHLEQLRRLAPADATATLSLFLDVLPDSGLRDTPDPYYGDARGFEQVFDLCERGAAAWLARVRPDR
ncbi:low molecular weight protein-tyrosine-phosphatase [Azospirillum griseum]|uniref:protein-tyrosine-phosphatase n=1 Tax=Azospirillum griseum TaxID=2496639 RepID=A0A3S0HYX3_9PROT|nr:low molecular weight protein-tyrosine-phosphatase [Azospirillum griseum]RTR22054.1 low molecular weight phosphotyrosine protein phosphatase [Azospirillum griseum]